MAIEGFAQSHNKIEDNEDISVIFKEEQTLKIYPFSFLFKNQSKQMKLYYEWTIMRQAGKGDLQKVIQPSGCELGQDNILLRIPKYPLSFRKLTSQRPSSLALGLEVLHTLGYVHKDLKPENVMISLKPLKATLIDFNRSNPLAQSTQGACRGTLRVSFHKRKICEMEVPSGIFGLSGTRSLKLTLD